MFPYADINPTRTKPVVNIGLIVINCLVFLAMLGMSDARQQWFVYNFGLVPAEIFHGNVPGSTLLHPGLSSLTSMFLHGGFMHLAGNMLYLWVFGDNIEDELGHVKYLLFYLAGGYVAAACQVGAAWIMASLHHTMEPLLVPTIGASGAISAVLGAYIVRYPHARIKTFIFLVIFFTVIELPALWVLGYWFLLQAFSGLGSFSAVQTGGGVAWWAHIGGFVFGYLAFRPRGRGRILGEGRAIFRGRGGRYWN